MRREELYLTDIVDACVAVGGFIHSKRRAQFAGDDLLRSAVLQKLTIIGEAAARLPSDFREQYTEIEWADIAAFRNIAVHAYFDIDWDIVWVTATKNVPELKGKIETLLKSF